MSRLALAVFVAVLGIAACGDDPENVGGSGGTGGAGAGEGGAGAGGSTMTRWPCTEQGIRDAVAQGGGPHTFACDGPTTVATQATIEITGDVILDGEENLIVSGDDSHRVLSVQRPARADLRNLTVTKGSAVGFGGAIFNDSGTLLLANCEIVDNRASEGAGGIFSPGDASTLEIVDSVVTGNEAPGIGGISGGGRVSITGSTIAQNLGGGMLLGGDVTVGSSTISDNVGVGVWVAGTALIFQSTITGNGNTLGGGGIVNSGDLILNRSTVSGNEGLAGGGVFNVGFLSMNETAVMGNTAEEGGGVYSSDALRFAENGDLWLASVALVDINSSTISGNNAQRGAGVYSIALRLAVWNSTISDNAATESGGGVYIGGTTLGASTIFFNMNTIVGNSAPLASALVGTGETPTLRLAGNVIDGNCATEGGAVVWTSEGYNVESPGDTCGFVDATDMVSVASEQLNLGSLGDNGGETPTRLPLVGSVLIDAIPLEECAVVLPTGPPLLDQRTVDRPQGPGCDVGSVEVGP